MTNKHYYDGCTECVGRLEEAAARLARHVLSMTYSYIPYDEAEEVLSILEYPDASP